MQLPAPFQWNVPITDEGLRIFTNGFEGNADLSLNFSHKGSSLA